MKRTIIATIAALGLLIPAPSPALILTTNVPAYYTSYGLGQWINTGLNLTENTDILTITAEGGWSWGWSDGNHPCLFDGPDGYIGQSSCAWVYPPPSPGQPIVGTLVGYIGPDPTQRYNNDFFFIVGSYFNGPAQYSGPLWLTINDDSNPSICTLSDNGGSVVAQISVNEPAPVPPHCRSEAVPSEPSLVNNQFSFTAMGPQGTTWNVYSSVDYKTWTLCGSLSFPLGDSLTQALGPFVDPNAITTPASQPAHKFYKLVNGSCCSVAIGFSQFQLQAGQSAYIANSFDSCQGGITHNAIQSVFQYSALKNGVILSFWTGSTWNNYTWNTGGWSGTPADPALNPGQGVRLSNPTTDTNAITVSFMGLLREHHWASLPAGNSFQGSMIPLVGGIHTQLNYPLIDGDLVAKYDAYGNPTYFIYDSSVGICQDNWYDGSYNCSYEPTLGDSPWGISEAVLINTAPHAWTFDISPCYCSMQH